MGRALRNAVALALLAAAVCTAGAMVILAACGQAPAPVRFFAEARPQHLSAWQVLMRKSTRLELNDGVAPYDLNTPLFDYAHKLRTVWLPPGTTAHYSATDAFEFPVGTIISKTLYYPRASGADAVTRTYDSSRDFSGTGLDLSQVRLIETRLLVRREEGWVALPYVWNAAQTDAELAPSGDKPEHQLVAGVHAGTQE